MPSEEGFLSQVVKDLDALFIAVGEPRCPRLLSAFKDNANLPITLKVNNSFKEAIDRLKVLVENDPPLKPLIWGGLAKRLISMFLISLPSESSLRDTVPDPQISIRVSALSYPYQSEIGIVD